MRNDDNIDFTCDTEDCINWKEGVCRYPAAITIQEHCCVNYERNIFSIAPAERMAEIAVSAIEYFGETLTRRDLYDALSCTLGMTDTEILAAGFAVLKEFMREKNDDGP